MLARNTDFLLRNSLGALISLNTAGRNFSAFARLEIGASAPASHPIANFAL